MIRSMDGGWGAMCGAMAMSRDALENRIYERKGQGLLVDTAITMQSFSRTTLFAEAIATASGGTFVKLPDDLDCNNEALMTKFQSLYVELGTFSADFTEATFNDEIDAREQAKLEADVARMHKVINELLALMLRVYKPQQQQRAAA
jgi:hypothetical protein